MRLTWLNVRKIGEIEMKSCNMALEVYKSVSKTV